MKAITLPPFEAAAVASGEKWLLSRNSTSNHRGTLLIHAAEVEPLSYRPDLTSASTGAIVAIAELTLVVPWSTINARSHDLVACANRLPGCRRSWAEMRQQPHNRDCQYAWIVEDVYRLPSPIPCNGHSGLWECAPSILFDRLTHAKRLATM